MKLKNAVAERIKILMAERNLNQYQLYKLTGVPQSTISTILNVDTKTIKLSTIYEICDGLQIELSDFFDYKSLKLNKLED